MITAIRRLFSSTLGKVLALAFVAIIGVGFALGDVTGNATFGGFGGADVAKVGNRAIGLGDLREAAQNAYEQARQEQPTLTMAAFVESGGLQQALDNLVEGAAFDQYADQLGFTASKRQIDGRIADLPVFAGVTGKFDQARYTQFLKQNGITEDELRADIGRQIIIEQLVVPVGTMPRVSPAMAQPYAALMLEDRRGLATFIPASRFAPTTTPDDKTLTSYLNANKARYTIPERRVVQYALFDRSAAPVPAVTEAEVAKYYKDNAARFAASETRRFDQVIAPDEATARKIADAARAGASLDAAAKTAGLSALATDMTTEAAFADQTSPATAKQAFAAKRGDVIGPVKAPLGYTVLRVSAVESVAARTLDQARADITQTLKAQKADNAVVDFYNSVQDAVNNGAPIEELAADRKLKLIETPAILPSGRSVGSAAGKPVAPPPVVAAAFQSPGEGEAQLTTLVQDQLFAIVAVKQIIAAAPPPMAQIRPALIKDWQLAEGQKAARDKARALVKAVESKKQTLGQAVAAAGSGAQPPQMIGGVRGQVTQGGKGVPPEVALLFSMAPGTVKTLELPGNRGWMVIALDKVTRPDPAKVDPKAVAAVAAPLGSALGNELVQQLTREARRTVGVRINQTLVDQLRRELTGKLATGE